MVFDYFDMLSGEPIFVPGIGHFRSPRLRDLTPGGGVGCSVYNLYLNLLAWDKDKLVKYGAAMQFKGAEKLEEADVSFFDALSVVPSLREACGEAMSFFLLENIVWDNDGSRYLTFTRGEDGNVCAVGVIDGSVFEDVRARMLAMNYIGLDKDQKPTGYDSPQTKALWEKAQKFLAEQSKNERREDKPEFHLSNIISKLCAVHPSYNLLNVYDLTVFQLYDAFFQCGYMRSTDLSERIFCNHGGKSFKFENWLKPIFHNI